MLGHGYLGFLNIEAYLIFYTITLFFGITIGSFLNVCIYRIPKNESLSKQSSHCPKCNNKIKAYDLIPLFSWLFLRGKCRYCKEKISPRYPIVEGLNALVYILAFSYIDMFETPLHGVITALFFSILIVIGFIDYDTLEIDVRLLFGILILGVLSAVFTDTLPLKARIIGVFCVSVPFFIIGELSSIYIKKKTGEKMRGIELGDTLLMLCSGFLIGYKAIIASAFIGILIAAVVGVINKLKTKESKFAFGPYLAIGIFAGFFLGEKIINWYINLITYKP